MRRQIYQCVFRVYEFLMWPSGLPKQRMGANASVVGNVRLGLLIANSWVIVALFVWMITDNHPSRMVGQWLAVSDVVGYVALGSWVGVNVTTVSLALLRVFPSRSEEACWLALALVGTLIAAVLINAPFAPGANWD